MNQSYKLSPYEHDVIELYNQTKSIEILSDRFGANKNSVRRFLKSRGFNFSKAKYQIDETYFDTIDTQEKAYILGFLYADGNHIAKNGKYTIRLNIHNKDIQILYDINKLLNHNKPIRLYKQMSELEIANKHVSQKMIGYGLMPNKTFSLTFPEWMPDNLKWHFIRGYFDGDGSVYITKPYAKMKSPSCGVSIVGTEFFCVSLGHILKEELDINTYMRSRHPERNTTTRQIYIGGNRQAKKFLDRIYLGASMYLARKYDIYHKHYYTN